MGLVGGEIRCGEGGGREAIGGRGGKIRVGGLRVIVK